jgi:hypothetical protein
MTHFEQKAHFSSIFVFFSRKGYFDFKAAKGAGRGWQKYL